MVSVFPSVFIMSGLFNSYEEDCNDSIRQIKESLTKLRDGITAQEESKADVSKVYHPPPATGPLSRTQQIQAVQQSLSHVKDLITSMGYEANDLDPAQRAAAKEKVDHLRRDVVQLEQETARLRQASTAADRSDLLAFGSGAQREAGGVVEAADAETQAHRLFAVQTTEKLQSGTQTLRKAEAFLAASNDLGRNSLNTLRSQTEQMQHIQETTHDVDEEVSRSRQVLNRMQRTALKHKLWLCSIIGLLLLFIFLLFYLHGR